jgi:CheY-like chemotaxis protein
MALALRPRVALIDVGLPGIDGFDVAQRLREAPEGRAMFLVALTGHGTASDRARAIAAGFDLHMVKPVSAADLERALAAAESQTLAPGLE